MSTLPPPLRIFVAEDLAPGAVVPLPPDKAHHLRAVMRRGVGDPVRLFNGRHGEWDGMIQALDKKTALAQVRGQYRPQETTADPWLLFAPLKKDATDFLVEKATELGVARLVPVLTDHTVTRRVNVARLAATARGAAEQCERLSVPTIDAPISLAAALRDWPKDRTLIVGDEHGNAQPLATALREGPCHPHIGLLVGPEGGFSTSELTAPRALPFVLPVTLGPRILRAETAAIAALAVWQAIAGDANRPPAPRG
ncbi:MAG: 16S rRNA (uracil(1498)-N(3))-methyltransferase [Magnetospiraceae bacterium]